MLALLSPVSTDQYFCYDYTTCRAGLLAALERLSVLPQQRLSWSCDDGAGLQCDAVWLGPATAKKILVLISGTHGVEGYAGSAIQRYLLDALYVGGESLPDDTAILVIHALNPWGMLWGRRCDAQGIDTNRNFVDFEQLPAPAEEYPDLLEAFATKDAQERRRELATLALQWGQRRYEEVLSGGQYQADWAPFYGGRAPGFARDCIEQLSQHWGLHEREQIVLDLHTGLGPWSFGELISDHAHGSKANDYAYRLFGEAVACTHSGDSFSVPKRGLLDFHWHEMMQEMGCFLTLEFGSYGTEALFRVLLDDHRFWLHHDGCKEAALHAPIKEAMLRHFCPRDTFWQQSVLWRSWQVAQGSLSFFADKTR